MENKAMRLRTEARDFGRNYEYKMAALLATKLALDSAVADFRMVCNIEGAGAFDDIVIEIKDQKGSMNVYCIQLKHRENSTLQIGTFEHTLVKYEETYMHFKDKINKIEILKNVDIQHIHLVYYTNAPLRCQKENSIMVRSIDCTNFLCTSTQEKAVFEIYNLPTSSKPFDENFLHQFSLYTNQAEEPKLDALIRGELYRKFQDISNTSVGSLVNFFSKWSLGRKDKITILTKNKLEERLLEFILLPYMVDPGIGTYKDEDVMETLRKTLVNFNVTNISQTRHLDNIFAMIRLKLNMTCGIVIDDSLPWNANIAPDQLDTIYKRNSDKDKDLIRSVLQERQQFLPHLVLRDLYFSAWSSRVTPMILDCRSAPELIVEVLTAFGCITRSLSFVLLGSLPTIIANLFTFENLCSLNDEKLLHKNLDTLSISLQGKSYISLKRLSSNKEIFRGIKPDAYLSLLMTPPVLGLNNVVADYYIGRTLIKPTFKLALLDDDNFHLRKRNLFIVIEEEQSLLWNYTDYKMDLRTYLKNMEVTVQKKDIYILTSNEDVEELAKKARILHDFTNKNVHILGIKRNDSLEWMISEGSVDVLEEYIADPSERSILSEDTLVNDQISKPKIICSNAGMGKTSLLKSVAGKFEENEWVSYVVLSDYASQILSFESTDEIIEYLFHEQMKNCEECLREFVYNIIIHSSNGHMTWLFDGYDEVASPKMLYFLKNMTRMKLWITTRPTFKNDLENNLGSLSYDLTCFSSKDNNNFLQMYFENHHVFKYDRTQIDFIVRSIEKCSSSLEESFVGIPIQTKMMAEVFGYDLNDDERRFTITQLYNKFIDIKLKEYTLYEATSLKRTISKLALMVFYNKDTLEHFIDFDELNEESVAFKQTYKKDSIITGINNNGKVLFGHKTFAEFLAAQWLAKKIVDKRTSGNSDHNCLPLVKMLFFHELRPVRLFFDRILSEGLILHSAVLANDMEKTIELLRSNDGVTDLDILGRSALQVAVTYGAFYDLYRASDIQGINNISPHSYKGRSEPVIDNRIPKVHTQQISSDIVELLIDHGFTNKKDLLGYDLFDSAMKSCSLEVVNSLCRKFSTVNLLFEKEFIFEVFVYLIVHRNFHHILSKPRYNNFSELSVIENLDIRGMILEKKELLQSKYEGKYLTEIAACQGSKEILFILLSTGILSIEHGFPLHRACRNGHSEIVRMLCEMGADVEKEGVKGTNVDLPEADSQEESDITYLLKNYNLSVVDKDSTLTPLHFACQGGNLDCVVGLLEMGADAKKIDGFGFSPLGYAGSYGFPKVIEILLAKTDIPTELIQKACFANFTNYKGCLRKLLDYVDINSIDNNGNTFLMLACRADCSDVVKLLTSNNNCNLNLLNSQEKFQDILRWAEGNYHALLSVKLKPLGPKPLNSGRGGVGALHFAVRHGYAECVEALLDSGADKHLKDEVEGLGYTPLVWASLYGQEEITKLLVSRSYRTEHAHEIELALRWASILGYRDCVKYLIDLIPIVQRNHGVFEHMEAIIFAESDLYAGHIDLMGAEGLNDALHWAARTGDAKRVSDMIEVGVDAHSTDGVVGMGYYPIVWASLYRELEVVRVFLEHEDREFLKNKNLHYALNWACVGGDDEIIKILLNFGLDVDVIDQNLTGNTPLISACQYAGTPETINLLISHNCNIAIKNDEGKTALDIALEYKKIFLARNILLQGEFEIDKESSTYKYLQKALMWAVGQYDFELIYRLLELGVEKNPPH